MVLARRLRPRQRLALVGYFPHPASRTTPSPGAPRWPPARSGRSSRRGCGTTRTLHDRTLVQTLNAYGYHIGLAIVFFGFLPHIAFIHRLTGLSWPAVPGWLFVAGVALVFVGLVYVFFARLTDPVLQLLSNFDDYFSWIVMMLPLVTGMALIHGSLRQQIPPAKYPVPLALHLLSLELLLIWMPFGKLSHAFLVFISRGTTGAAFARKGARP